jgi:hypothetical protein
MRSRLPWLPVAAILAGAVVPTANAGLKAFQTPSKRIRCAYITGSDTPATIRCDMLFLNDRAAVVTHRGKGRIVHVTDTVSDPGARILKYGTTTRFGDFTCTSRETGLTCRSRRSRHGFTISTRSRTVF